CPLLRDLTAINCNFTALPPNFGDRLQHLEVLDLYGNELTSLPPSFAKLAKLRQLDLRNNPLQEPPREVANRGFDAIKSYFEELEKGERTSKLLKVVLVGDAEAGKTSLRNALEGSPNPRQAEEDRTVHVEIKQIPLYPDSDSAALATLCNALPADSSDADLAINVYDC
ncbi:MAG: leucine-rich repeat domain-containing protein, partial [Planctomycetota bacterium]